MTYAIELARDRVDLDVAWRFLSTEAYWRRDRTRAEFDAQVAAAWLLAGAYAGDAMVGFAKANTDVEGWAWLDDVFVLAGHRGHGLGKRLVEAVLAEGPERRWRLRTKDAHGLYARFGFVAVDDILMERPVMEGGAAT